MPKYFSGFALVCAALFVSSGSCGRGPSGLTGNTDAGETGDAGSELGGGAGGDVGGGIGGGDSGGGDLGGGNSGGGTNSGDAGGGGVAGGQGGGDAGALDAGGGGSVTDAGVFVLVGAGDIASGLPYDEATAKLLDNIPGTVFTAGDNAYDGTVGGYSSYYQPTWGRHKSRTYPSIGNHDYPSGSDATAYFNYFGLRAGEKGKGYYSYDLGAWHIVVINSNCQYVGGCGAGSPQEKWLRNDLATSGKKCTLAYWHHPRFSSGSTHGNNSSMTSIWKALYDYGAEIVVSGHDHTYERFAPQTHTGAADAKGIVEFVVGTGGAGLTGFNTPVANSVKRWVGGHGVIKFTLRSTQANFEFVSVAGKTFTDTGTIQCH